jgi:hypothetical protein
LLFTYAPSGVDGNTFFAVPISNSVDGPLSPLAGGGTVMATTAVQDLLTFQAGSDTYTLQFQDLAGSNGAVPEPATWAMMLLGFGMVGFAMRKRSNVRTTVKFA